MPSGQYLMQWALSLRYYEICCVGRALSYKKSPIFRNCTHKDHFLDDGFTERHTFVAVVVLDEENGHGLVLARPGQNSLH